MSWNYRIFRDDAAEDPWFYIIEVYYDEDGKPVMMSNEIGIAGCSMEELEQDLKWYSAAFDREVLIKGDFE